MVSSQEVSVTAVVILSGSKFRYFYLAGQEIIILTVLPELCHFVNFAEYVLPDFRTGYAF